jgi:hypothetical protein
MRIAISLRFAAISFRIGFCLDKVRFAHHSAAEYSFTRDGWHYSSFFNTSNAGFE